MKLIAHDNQNQRGGRRSDKAQQRGHDLPRRRAVDGLMHAQRAQNNAQQHADAGFVGQHVFDDELGRHFLAARRLERRQKDSVGEHRLADIDHGVCLGLIRAAEQRIERIAEHAALRAGHQQRHEAVIRLHEPAQAVACRQRRAVSGEHQREHQQHPPAVFGGEKCLKQHDRQQNIADHIFEARMLVVA